jgi:hypothetical protein
VRLAKKRIQRILGRAGCYCDRCGELWATQIIRVKKPVWYLDDLEAVCEFCAKKPHVVEVVWKNAEKRTGSGA